MTTLRCAACHRKCRVLLHGLWPTCAKQLGITPPRSQTRKSTLARRPGRRKARGAPTTQLALFEVSP